MLVNGVDGAGKGETVNLLNEWLDPRHVRSRRLRPAHAKKSGAPADVALLAGAPGEGQDRHPLRQLVHGPDHRPRPAPTEPHGAPGAIERIRRFERLLTDDGALIVKLWFHLSKKAMKKRLEELESNKLTRWRVTKADWENFDRYDDFAKVSERVLRETSTGDAPWVVIDGSDPNYRAITAAKTLLGAIHGRLAEAKARRPRGKRPHGGNARRSSEASTATAPVFETVDTVAHPARSPVQGAPLEGEVRDEDRARRRARSRSSAARRR